MLASAGRLDLDDLGAEVGELKRAIRHGENLAEVDYADSVERQGHRWNSHFGWNTHFGCNSHFRNTQFRSYREVAEAAAQRGYPEVANPLNIVGAPSTLERQVDAAHVRDGGGELRDRGGAALTALGARQRGRLDVGGEAVGNLAPVLPKGALGDGERIASVAEDVVGGGAGVIENRAGGGGGGGARAGSV